MSWEDFLADQTHFNLYVSALVYMPTIKLIRRVARPGERVLEAGCGSGRTSMLLADMGYRVAALDISFHLLQQVARAGLFFQEMHSVNGDIGFLPFTDKAFVVSYSCGVLEHFTPEAIVPLLTEQRRVAHHVLVDVPNDRCKKKAYGDENFYPDSQWQEMFVAAGLSIDRMMHRGLDRGAYAGNCTVILASDSDHPRPLDEVVDVYDHY